MIEKWTVVLIATRGLGSFVENSLIGIQQCGIDPSIVQVILPHNATSELLSVVNRFRARPRILEEFAGLKVGPMPMHYVQYGTLDFNRLTRVRFPLIRTILRESERLIYADLDVAWLRNPIPYLSGVLDAFPWACQTEAFAAFPAPFCVGFFATRSHPGSLDLLDQCIARFERHSDEFSLQTIFQQIVTEKSCWKEYIFPLPEGIFPNGLLYQTLLGREAQPVAMEGQLAPFIFHANWTEGFENKRRLLAHCGCWSVS